MTATVINLADRRPIRRHCAKESRIVAMPGDRPATLRAIQQLEDLQGRQSRDIADLMTEWTLRLKILNTREYGPGFYLDDPKP